MDVFDRYLRLLNVPRREPGGDALKELVRAHLFAVPFENISKLYYKRRGWQTLPDLELFMDGIESHHFGGTCYANNYHLYCLLAHLGYDVTLCGADMSNPDVHVVSMVHLEGREYLVDVGYTAPFLEPLPRDLPEDYVITEGERRYVLSPQDGEGRSRLKLYHAEKAIHGYTVKPGPKTIADFAPAIAASYRAEATFMNAVLIVKYAPNGSRVLHNLESLETLDGQVTRRTLASRAKIAAEAERLFDMPRDMVMEAVRELPALRDAWD